jgi:pimeloyl-ACP methyl ester carboxylesterase
LELDDLLIVKAITLPINNTVLYLLNKFVNQIDKERSTHTMLKNLIIILIGVLMSSNCLANQPTKAETVIINGKKIYYEVYGEGKPLFLLHGYTQSSKVWHDHVNDYIDDYQIYLVDLAGHGKSDAFTETLSIKKVAEDLNTLIQYLELDKINALGFSYGGDVLYQLALINSSIIDSMVTIGSVGSWSIDDYPEVEKSFTYEIAKDYPWIKGAHKSEEQVRIMFEQFKNYTIHMSNDDLKSIKTNILIVAGDDDQGVPLEEVIRSRKYLPNSDLWIVPNVGHGGYDAENKETFVRLSKNFLAYKTR